MSNYPDGLSNADLKRLDGGTEHWKRCEEMNDQPYPDGAMHGCICDEIDNEDDGSDDGDMRRRWARGD